MRVNAVLFVKKALKLAKGIENPIIIFEKGRYDFWPQYSEERDYCESNTTDVNPKRLAILIDHATNLIIDGNGADFVFHDRIQPFTIDHSANVAIKNLTIDWDIPLTAQAEVMEIEEAGHWVVEESTDQIVTRLQAFLNQNVEAV